jgi:dinuclear metal center protein, YbgI/SA1388 family
MLCSKIIDVLNKIAPESFALEWDNVGLLVGDKNNEINKIIIGLDLTNEIINQAIKSNVNMIITHHPIFFKGIKKITDSPESKRVIRLIKHNICHYAAHTNLDICQTGTNFALFNLLELENMQGLEDLKYGFMGRVGQLKNKMMLENFANFIKNKLGLEKINFYGDKNAMIKKVALCTGSASNYVYFLLAKKNNCDVYLTGDIKYHDALLALDLNLNLIDVTHHASEKIFAPVLKNEINKYLPNMQIICEKYNDDLFHVL